VKDRKNVKNLNTHYWCRRDTSVYTRTYNTVCPSAKCLSYVVAIGSVPYGIKWKKQHIMTQEKAKCGPKYHNNLVKSSF
jgi:hypothetical protein